MPTKRKFQILNLWGQEMSKHYGFLFYFIFQGEEFKENKLEQWLHLPTQNI